MIASAVVNYSFALASIVVSRGECDYDGDSDRFSGNASLMFHNRRRCIC